MNFYKSRGQYALFDFEQIAPEDLLAGNVLKETAMGDNVPEMAVGAEEMKCEDLVKGL